MIFDIKLFDEKDVKGWDNFVMRNDNTTFFHQIGWKNVVEETYGHKPYYLFAENDNGKVIGILPMFLIKNVILGKRLISVPFASYGGACSENEDVGKALVDKAIQIGEDLGVDFYEFRSVGSSNMYKNFKDMKGYSTFVLDISNGKDYIWKEMNKKIRNMVRKGEKNNLKFEIEINYDIISKFFEIYSENMRHLGTPVHNKKFFENIYRSFAKDVIISTAKLNEDAVSSIYLLKFKDTIVSGWASSLVESLKYAPNDFVYWNSIKYACTNDILKFDFGRSLTKSDNSKFKERWGCTEFLLNYYYLPSTEILLPSQNKYGTFAKVWSKLPSNVTKIVGPRVRKYIP